MDNPVFTKNEKEVKEKPKKRNMDRGQDFLNAWKKIHDTHFAEDGPDIAVLLQHGDFFNAYGYALCSSTSSEEQTQQRYSHNLLAISEAGNFEIKENDTDKDLCSIGFPKTALEKYIGAWIYCTCV